MRLQSIQVLRALAVLPVVFFHFSDLRDGRAGVDLFFCISGFVMAGLMDQSPARFARDRVVRIYPPFLAALGLLFLLYPQPIEPEKLAKSLLLWPVRDEIYLYPAWSLSFEAMFYAACVSSMLVGGRALLVAFAIAFLFRVPFVGSGFVLEFLAGFAIARRQWWALPILLLAATFDPRILRYGPWAALILWLCTANEHWFRSRLWAPVAMIGDASYAIYLTHLPIGSKLVGELPLAVTIYGCIAGGVLFHFAVEKPLLRLFRRSRRRAAIEPEAKVPVPS